MKLKRTIAAILAFLALASFAGCRKDKKDDPASTSAGAVAAETSENETEEEETEEGAAGETKESEKAAGSSSVKMNPRTKKPYYFLDINSDLLGNSDWNNWVEVSNGSYKNGKYVIENEYFYDKSGNKTGEKRHNENGTSKFYPREVKYNGDGTVKSMPDDTSGQACIFYKYDSQKRVAEKELRFDDGAVYIHKYSYDKLGRLTELEELRKDDSKKTRLYGKTVFTYDKKGNPVLAKFEKGDFGSMSYDQVAMEYDAQNNLTQVKAHSVNGNWVLLAKNKYDGKNNLVERTYYDNRDGTVSNHTVIEYDKNNSITKFTQKRQASDDVGKWEVFQQVCENDKYGNVVKISRYSGESMEKLELDGVFAMSYKYEGNRVTVITERLDSADERLHNVTVYEYRSHAPMMTLEETNKFSVIEYLY